MRYLSAVPLLLALLLTGCGPGDTLRVETVDATAAKADAAAQKERAVRAEAALADAHKSNAELLDGITADKGIIEAARADIASKTAQIQTNNEAHWKLLADITAGILALGVLVFAFLAWESPVQRARLAMASAFCAVAAIVCVWVGQRIHVILDCAPYVIVALVVFGLAAVLTRGRIHDFVVAQWAKYSTELRAHVPEVAKQLDAASIAAQGAIKTDIDKLLAKAQGK